MNNIVSFVQTVRLQPYFMELEIDDEADGERYTGGKLWFHKFDPYIKSLCEQDEDNFPNVEVTIVRRVYTFSAVMFEDKGIEKKGKRGEHGYRILGFSAEDLVSIVDKPIRSVQHKE